MAEVPMDEEANINNYTQLDELLRKRISAWEYLQRVHLGATHWLNVTPVTAADLAEQLADASKTQRRCEEWLCLGASLASLIPIGRGFPFVAAVHQLWDEFEAHFGYLTQAERRARTVKLEYLILPNIPSALDYQLVFAALLEVLIVTYSQFLDQSMATQMSNDVHAVFLKLDGRFRHYIYDPAMKLLNTVALSLVTLQMAALGFDRAALEAPTSLASEPPPLTASSSSASLSSASAAAAPPALPRQASKVKFTSVPAGRHRKEGDTHVYEDLMLVDDPNDTEGYPISLLITMEGVTVRGQGGEVMHPFRTIPKFRCDDKSAYFEFDTDKPGGGVLVQRIKTHQAQKIYNEIAATVDKLVKMRSAKK